MKKLFYFFAVGVLALGMAACGESNEPEQPEQLPEGALPGKFSVGFGKQVRFSIGNLRYQAFNETTYKPVWQFAEEQYLAGLGKENEKMSQYNKDLTDLFQWATSGVAGLNPYDVNHDADWYGDGSKDIAGTPLDWGVSNAIINGGNKAGLWRTLTLSEWNYLFQGRNLGAQKFGFAIIAGSFKGLVLLPDDWKAPEGITFNSANSKGFNLNSSGYWTHETTEGYSHYKDNQYSMPQWGEMEKAGAVFLPITGWMRLENSSWDEKLVFYAEESGYYWTSTADGAEKAYAVGFSSEYIHYIYPGNFDGLRSLFSSVRLVQDVK